LFIDYTNEFYEILRRKLWDKIRKEGHTEHVTETAEDTYEDKNICIDTARS
jgi:phosphoribosyl-AMP cyclohydrolase